MKKCFSMAFDYREQRYYCIVRVRQKEKGKEFHVRIMNSQLDRLLYGNHVFIKRNNHWLIAAGKQHTAVVALQKKVHESLKQMANEK